MRAIIISDTHGNREHERKAAEYVEGAVGSLEKEEKLAFIWAGDFLPELEKNTGYVANTFKQWDYLNSMLVPYFRTLKDRIQGKTGERDKFQIYLASGNKDYLGAVKTLGDEEFSDAFCFLNDKIVVSLDGKYRLYGYKYSLPSPHQPKDWERWDSAEDREKQKQNSENKGDSITLKREDFDENYNPKVPNSDVSYKPGTIGYRGLDSTDVRKGIVEVESINLEEDRGSVESSFNRKKFLEDIADSSHKLIIVGHGIAPYDSTLDLVEPGKHVGSKAFRKFLEQYDKYVALAIHGHFHKTLQIAERLAQTEGKTLTDSFKYKIGKTLCVTTGNDPDGLLALLDIDLNNIEQAKRVVL